MYRHSFTLIELVVVIAIIAILAAMLMPALESVRKKAQRIKCLNQHKQILLSVSMYVNDFDGALPYQPKSSSQDIWRMTGTDSWENPDTVGLGLLYTGEYLPMGTFREVMVPRNDVELVSGNNERTHSGYAAIDKDSFGGFAGWHKSCATSILLNTIHNGQRRRVTSSILSSQPLLGDFVIRPNLGTYYDCKSHLGEGLHVGYIDGSANWFTTDEYMDRVPAQSGYPYMNHQYSGNLWTDWQ